MPADLPGDFPDVAYRKADLSEEAERIGLLEWLPRSLDRAILCAGCGHYRPLAHENAADIAEAVEVNLAAAIHLVHGLYRPLSVRAGRIAFVGSVARKGASTMPVYAATKAALDGFARSLAIEWRGRIVVKALHPGPTATGMSVRSGRPAHPLDRMMLPPAAVAEAMLTAVEGNRGYQTTISYAHLMTCFFIQNLMR